MEDGKNSEVWTQEVWWKDLVHLHHPSGVVASVLPFVFWIVTHIYMLPLPHMVHCCILSFFVTQVDCR